MSGIKKGKESFMSHSRKATRSRGSSEEDASQAQRNVRQRLMPIANSAQGEPKIKSEPLGSPPNESLLVERRRKCRPRNNINVIIPDDLPCKINETFSIKQELEQSIHVAPLEWAAAWDLDDGEDSDASMDDDYDHVRQWVNGLPPLGTLKTSPRSCRTLSSSEVESEVPGTLSAQVVDPLQPGPSGVKAKSKRHSAGTAAEGSEFDSDYDDEFHLEEVAAFGGMSRGIPDDEELDEPVRNIVTSVEKAMDDANDQLLGASGVFDWREDYATFQGVPEVFTGPTPGPVKDYDTPYDAFTDIFNVDIMEYIAKETNRYAKQVIDKRIQTEKLTPASRLSRWVETNKDEMYVLFAIYMLMGLDPRTSQHEYWKTVGYLEMPKFRQVMTCNRFILLNKFLHFMNNSDENLDLCSQSGKFLISPKLRKIAPILSHLNDRFENLYNLHPEIAIDESLTLFKGRLSWIQTIKTKAPRIGIKSFELCESRTGYLYRFEIYTGKNNDQNHLIASCVALGSKSTQVVMDLLKGLEHRGHCVTIDNYYNSPALARYLKSLGFDCLGTLRPNRSNVPDEIKNAPKDAPKGTIIARHSGDVSCIAWKDTRMVTMISTYHDKETYVVRKSGRDIVKPIVVKDYNNTMGGVDLKDQKLLMYLLERKRCLKWYMKTFKRLINISVHNAFILLLGSLKRRKMPLITHRSFREQLANSLVETHRHLPQQEVATVEIDMRLRKDVVHVPKHLTRTTRKRCLVCARNNIKKMVYLECATCDEAMCFGGCWLKWHSHETLPGRDIHIRKRRRRDVE